MTRRNSLKQKLLNKTKEVKPLSNTAPWQGMQAGIKHNSNSTRPIKADAREPEGYSV